MTKHTLNGRRRKVIKTSGFRARLATKTGRKILRNRRRKAKHRGILSPNRGALTFVVVDDLLT